MALGEERMTFKWDPWETYKDVKPYLIPIEEPPCKHCHYWNPMCVFNKDGEFTGIECCHAAELFSDFSCFVNKEAK